MKGLLKILRLVIPIGLAAFLMWYTFRDPEQRNELFAAIKSANFIWIALSMILAFFSHVIRAKRWHYLLHPLGYGTRLGNRYHAIMIGYFINMLIPRMGEISRAAYFHRFEKVPLDRTVGTIAAERVIDLLIFGLVILLAVASQFDILYDALQTSLASREDTADGGTNWKLIVLAVLFPVGAFLVYKFKLIGKIKSFIGGILEGLSSIWKTEFKTRFLLDSVLIWLLYVSMFAVCFQAFEESSTLGYGAMLAGFIFGTLAVIFTPGGTGAYHLAVAFGLGFYGLSENIGLALGLLLWGSQMLMYILLGFLSLLLMPPYNKGYSGHASIAT